MLRRLIQTFLLGAVASSAAIWPEQWYDHKRTALQPIQLADAAVWEEYGLDAAETAQYGAWKATGYRLKDPTSALAVYQWIRPAQGKPSDLEKVAIQSGKRVVILKGNYVLDIQGHIPTPEEMAILHVQLVRLDQSALPSLANYMPTRNLVAGSERFVVGPTSLARFEPRIPASVAAFSLGAEAQLARYSSPAGELNLALFSYPTPQIARERASEFQRIEGARVKRAGPLVAVTLQAPSADEAEKLLAQVNYQATITWNENTISQEASTARFLIQVFLFIGLLLVFAVLCGLLYGGFRIARRRWRGQAEDEDAMVTLQLGKK